MRNILSRLIDASRVSIWDGFGILRHDYDEGLIDFMCGSRQVSWRGPERALVVGELAEKLSMCCPELDPEEKDIELAEMAAKSQHQGPESWLFREMRDLVVDGANPEFLTEQGSYLQLLPNHRDCSPGEPLPRAGAELCQGVFGSPRQWRAGLLSPFSQSRCVGRELC